MLPEEVLHVGWVIDNISGDGGVTGWLFIVTLADDAEVHPWEFVTLKVYDPGGTPETEAVVPDPEVVTPPGVRVTVHVPEEGRSRRLTVPPGVVQSGWITELITGAWGRLLIIIVTVVVKAHWPAFGVKV